MTKAKKDPDEKFSAELERAISKVLRNPKASRREKVDAIKAGTDLLLVKHKIKGGSDDGQFFG